ncbi:MAG: hypothetical protein KAR30_00840, partial [Gammaproteobacteria bacterium]|nr:hypothetical protein [Gammaproteobacteria bacterium]
MKVSEHYSDEILNAYIDGELNNQDRASLLEELQKNRELGLRVCKLQKTQDMVQLAYEDINIPEQYTQQQTTGFNNRLRMSIAAGILLLIGISSGWIAHTQLTPENSLLQMAQTTTSGQSSSSKIMLHVTTEDPVKLAAVLEETENLLQSPESSAGNLRVEVLANGKGLNLLRADNSQFSQRVQALQERYDNLVF